MPTPAKKGGEELTGGYPGSSMVRQEADQRKERTRRMVRREVEQKLFQEVVEGKITQEWARRKAKERKLDRAATKIQKVARGRRGRKKAKRHKMVETLKTDAEAVHAATQIQAVARGRTGRKKAKQRRKTGAAALEHSRRLEAAAAADATGGIAFF